MTEEIHASSEALARRAAEWMQARLSAAISERGSAHLALSGGKSPLATYERLGSLPFEWSKLSVYVVDERSVPAEDPNRNDLQIRKTLFANAAAQSAQFFGIPFKIRVTAAAAEYDLTLRTQFKKSTHTFDVLVLGMGVDGHIASLFPESVALAESARWAVATEPNGVPKVERVTMTLPPILRARDILFLIRGSEKRALHEKLKRKDPTTAALPVTRIIESPDVLTTWLIDSSE